MIQILLSNKRWILVILVIVSTYTVLSFIGCTITSRGECWLTEPQIEERGANVIGWIPPQLRTITATQNQTTSYNVIRKLHRSIRSSDHNASLPNGITIFLSQNCESPGTFYHFILTNPKILLFDIHIVISNSELENCIYVPDLFTYHILDVSKERDNHYCGSYESFIYSLFSCPTPYLWYIEPDIAIFDMNKMFSDIQKLMKQGCWVMGPVNHSRHKTHPDFLDGKSVYLVNKIFPMIYSVYPPINACSAFDLSLFFNYHVSGVEAFGFKNKTKREQVAIMKKRKLYHAPLKQDLLNATTYCKVDCYINVRDYGKGMTLQELDNVCAIA